MIGLTLHRQTTKKQLAAEAAYLQHLIFNRAHLRHSRSGFGNMSKLISGDPAIFEVPMARKFIR